MDFVSDQPYDGRRIRVLTIVDNHTRESLALQVGQRIRGIDVVAVLEQITQKHGLPKAIQVGNGPEFISKDLDRRAYWNQVRLDFSRPSKPTDDAMVESFISRFRQEYLNEHWFMSLDDTWRQEYNHHRSHSWLGCQSPAEFVGRSTTVESSIA